MGTFCKQVVRLSAGDPIDLLFGLLIFKTSFLTTIASFLIVVVQGPGAYVKYNFRNDFLVYEVRFLPQNGADQRFSLVEIEFDDLTTMQVVGTLIFLSLVLKNPIPQIVLLCLVKWDRRLSQLDWDVFR